MSRKVKSIITGLVGAFIIYNALWCIYVNYRYNPFCEIFDEGTDRLNIDGFTYYVKKPNYLSFTGNIAICEDVVVNYGQTQTQSVDLVIWPKGINQYEVGVSIGITTVNVEEHTANTEYINILLDENGELKEYNSKNYLLLEENKDKVEHLYELALDMWGISVLERYGGKD